MGERLVPNNEGEFLFKAESLGNKLVADPARFGIPPEEARAMHEAAVRFRAAYEAAYGGVRTPALTEEKRQARAAAKKQFVRCIDLIRLNDSLDVAARCVVGIKDRPARLKRRACPQEPPRLRFVRALHDGNGATPMHELAFDALDRSARPEGAVRLELFIDLIPPEEPIPDHPGANHGSKPWYLRSYTRSPIKIIPPMATVPMRVVYWGRWADSTGNVGPFSRTAAGWVEGGSMSQMGLDFNGNRNISQIELSESISQSGRDPAYRVAVLEMRYQSYLPQPVVSHELPEPTTSEPRRLEGPAESEAA